MRLSTTGDRAAGGRLGRSRRSSRESGIRDCEESEAIGQSRPSLTVSRRSLTPDGEQGIPSLLLTQVEFRHSGEDSEDRDGAGSRSSHGEKVYPDSHNGKDDEESEDQADGFQAIPVVQCP